MNVSDANQVPNHAKSARNGLLIDFSLDVCRRNKFLALKPVYFLNFQEFPDMRTRVQNIDSQYKKCSNFALRRDLKLKLHTQVALMCTTFVKNLRARSLRNQKIWNFLCLQIRISSEGQILDFFWKKLKNSCFWGKKIFWRHISRENSMGSRFLALSKWLHAYFRSKMIIFCGNLAISAIAISYISQIWPHQKRHIFGLRWALSLKFYRKLVLVSTRLGCNNSPTICCNREIQLIL